MRLKRFVFLGAVPVGALLLMLAIPSRAQSIFKDPHGRFTVRVPAGWQAQTIGEGGARIVKGTAYCNVSPSEPEDPGSAVKRLAEQIGGQWTKFQEIERGEAMFGGARAAFRFYSGKNPKGVVSFLKLTVNEQGMVLICSSAQSEYDAVKAAFEQIERGISNSGASAAGVSAASPASGNAGAMPPQGSATTPQGTGKGENYAPGLSGSSPAAGNTFSDPQGRFTLRVPAGWQAQSQGEQGAKVFKGESYVSVVVIAGHGTSNQLVGNLVGQIGPQWKEFKLIKQGTCVLSGRPADYVIFGGINPRGIVATLRVVGTSLPDVGYALIESAPAAEFNSVRETLEQIEQGFQIEGAPGGPGHSLSP